MDTLDVFNSYYDQKILDLQRRYDEQYGKIEEIEIQINDVQSQIRNIRQEKISVDNIYQLLLVFDEVYGFASEAEQKDGNWIRNIVFNFPVPVNGGEVKELPLEIETTVETIVLLSHKSPDSHINVKVEFGEG